MSENLNRDQVLRCSSWELATMARRRVKWRRGDKHVVNYKVIFHHWLCITWMLSSAESSLGIRAVSTSSAALEPRIMTDIRLKKKGGTISSGNLKRKNITQGLASMINESYWSYSGQVRLGAYVTFLSPSQSLLLRRCRTIPAIHGFPSAPFFLCS